MDLFDLEFIGHLGLWILWSIAVVGGTLQVTAAHSSDSSEDVLARSLWYVITGLLVEGIVSEMGWVIGWMM